MNHERALVLDLLGNVSRNQGSTLNDNFPSYFPPHLIIRGGGKQVGKFLFPLGDIIWKKQVHGHGLTTLLYWSQLNIHVYQSGPSCSKAG